MACEVNCSLDPITSACDQSNSVGISKVWAIVQCDVQAVTRTNNVISAFTFETGKNFVQLKGNELVGEVQYDDKFDEANDTSYRIAKVMLQIPKMTETTELAIDKMFGKKVILVVKDVNGKYHVVGDTDIPAKLLSSVGGTGKRQSGQFNGKNLEFQASSIPHGAWFYTGLEAALTTPGV